MKQLDVVIIGGGASGFFAAIHCKLFHPNVSVTLIEKSQHVLSKVRISGGGRCNVTHACYDPQSLIQCYPRGGKALLSLFHQFQPKDTVKWFENHGVSLKTESDNRMFPTTDSSSTIIQCLTNVAKNLSITTWTGTAIKEIAKKKNIFQLHFHSQTIECKKVILATGSSPKGFLFAQSLGHTIIPPIPSLFTFKIKDNALTQLQGLSVPEIHVSSPEQKSLHQDGPILITHWGLSGPSIIKLSAWGASFFHKKKYSFRIRIHWIPSLSNLTITHTLQTCKTSYPNKKIQSISPFDTIPLRLWKYLVKKSNIPLEHSWKNLSQTNISLLLTQITQDHHHVTGTSPFKEEFVTCGGVCLKEIDMKTMESTCCPGLHIIGECLNIDGITGGFNFQNAWTTGYIAGKHCMLP